MEKNKIAWMRITLTVLVSLFIVVLLFNVPYYNRFWFYFRHVSLYGIAVSLLLLITYLYVKELFNKYRLHQVVKYLIISLSIGLYIVAAIFMSNYQMNYIETRVIPPYKNTAYYDLYGNFLYRNRYNTSEISNVVYTYNGDNQLIFEADEYIFGEIRSANLSGNNIIYNMTNSDINIHVKVVLNYRLKGEVQSVDITYLEVRHNYSFEDDGGYTISTKIERTVENTIDGNKFYTTENNSKVVEKLNYLTDEPFISTDEDNYEYTDYDTVIYSSQLITSENQTNLEIRDEINNLRLLYGRVTDQNYTHTFNLNHYDDQGIFINKIYRYYQSHDQIVVTDEMEEGYSGGYPIMSKRTISFNRNNQVFLGMTISDISTIESFVVESSLINYNDEYHYDETDYIYSEHDDSVSKYIFTDDGIIVEDYDESKDRSGEFIYKDQTYIFESLFQSIDDIEYMYNYMYLIDSPGSMTALHFYPHNMLIESQIDN